LAQPVTGLTPGAYQPAHLAGAKGGLILGWASRLDAFSGYPVPA